MLGRELCVVWLIVDYLIGTVSVFSITLITLDRYWLVTKALEYRSQVTQDVWQREREREREIGAFSNEKE